MRPLGYTGSIRALLLISLSFVLACGGSDSPTGSPLGVLVGRVELEDSVPLDACFVNVEGTILGGTCTVDGLFRIDGVPAGTFTVQVASTDGTVAPTRKEVSLEAGENKNLGAIVLLAPGRVAGFYTPDDGLDPATSIVAVDDGVAAARPSGGQYLIEGVPDGTHSVELLFDGSTVVQVSVPVSPLNTTNIDFDLLQAENAQGQLTGTLVFEGDVPPSATIDLIRLPAQTVVTSARPSATGAFELIASPGCYLLSAHAADSTTRAVKQIVLVSGAQRDVGTFALLKTDKTLSLAADKDGNNIPDGLEPPCAAL